MFPVEFSELSLLQSQLFKNYQFHGTSGLLKSHWCLLETSPKNTSGVHDSILLSPPCWDRSGFFLQLFSDIVSLSLKP